MKSFSDKVKEVVSQIPKGGTMTYKEVAKKAGHPSAYRAVGTVLRHNFDPNVPCHRVVRSDGQIGKYNRGGPDKKKELLFSEKAI